MPHDDAGREMVLLAGTGRCDITPPPGTPQGGWGAQLHERGTGADMPMLATALALSDGAERWLIVEADAIGFNREWTEKILDAIELLTTVKREHIRFSCSHTHSGPNTFRLANITAGLDMITAYLDGLPQRIASAAWQALQGMEPVRAGFGSGLCRIARNRRVRTPEGEVIVGVNDEAQADHTMGVVRLDREDGTVLATMLHYACHPTTVGWQNNRFTPDYPGVARAVVEESVGGHCLFLQGAAGDLGPRRGFSGDLRLSKQLGEELGFGAASVALSIDTLRQKQRFTSVMPSGANIAVYEYEAYPARAVCRLVSCTLALPLRQLPPHTEIERELADVRARVQQARDAGETHTMQSLQAKATQMGWRLENSRLYAGQTTTDWPMQVMRLGDAALVSLAGEPFSSIAQRIRERSPAEHTFISGYSNGGFGYIPDRDAYEEGGYEVEATPFAPEAADVVVCEALKAINELFEEQESH